MPRPRSARSTGAPGSTPSLGRSRPGGRGRILDRAELKLTIVGGCGGWPAAGEACSGYLLENDGFRLLIDPGYAVVPKLLRTVAADQVDAVLVSHGHPDHCADLNPLLRARAFMDQPAEALPVHALPERARRRPGPRSAVDARRFVSARTLRGGRFDDRSGRSRSKPRCCHIRDPTRASGSRPMAPRSCTRVTADPMRRWSSWRATRTCCWPRRPTPRKCRPTPRRAVERRRRCAPGGRRGSPIAHPDPPAAGHGSAASAARGTSPIRRSRSRRASRPRPWSVGRA